MKPNTSLPYPKLPEIGPYRELDKSTSRITPDFIMVEFSITIHLRLGAPLDSYLLVFRLKSPSSVCVLGPGHLTSLHLNKSKIFGIEQRFLRPEVGVQVLPLK